MATFRKDSEDFDPSNIIAIVGTEITEDKYTVYIIQVRLGKYFWNVKHRYREFLELHEKLVTHHSLKKTLIPGKKLFGNQSESFIRKRQTELEVYLQTVISILTVIPPILGHFLEFNKYEIRGITASLAEELFSKGEWLLHTDSMYQLTALHLHAITERLKLPEPPCETGDPKQDLGHVLDFITRLRHLKVSGSTNTVGRSNINMNLLEFDLSPFKGLHILELQNCNTAKIVGLDVIKRSLKKIYAHRSVKAVKNVLQPEMSQWTPFGQDDATLPEWPKVTWLDLSENDITVMDESLKLLPRVEYLDFHDNRLEDMAFLDHLSCLTHIDLSNNCIHILNDLHLKLGNVKSLNLAGNKLESLQGMAKLYSLEYLDVGNNDVSQILEIRHVAHLPCLENLNMFGNPVTVVLDYRTKVLQLFANRAKEISLDNQKANERELDTVAVLLAIQKARDEKDRGKKTHSKKQSAEVSFEVPTASTSKRNSGTSECAEGGSREVGTLQSQIESIREKAGEGWLHTLNALQSAPVLKVHEFDSPYISPNLSPEATSETTVVLTQSKVSKTEPPPVLPVLVKGLLPTTLPDVDNLDLMSYLQKLTQQQGIDDPCRDILWCHLIYQPNPTSAFPCCVSITDQSLQLFEIIQEERTARSTDEALQMEMPCLKFHHCIAMESIVHIVTGMNDAYLKIFSKSSNVALVCLNSNPRFLDLMMRFKTNRACDRVLYSTENEEIQRSIESQSDGDVMVLYALCACCLYDVSDGQELDSECKTIEICALFVTSSKLFLARHNYFSNDESVQNSFHILRSFSLAANVERVETMWMSQGTEQCLKLSLREQREDAQSRLILEVFMADNLVRFGFLDIFPKVHYEKRDFEAVPEISPVGSVDGSSENDCGKEESLVSAVSELDVVDGTDSSDTAVTGGIDESLTNGKSDADVNTSDSVTQLSVQASTLEEDAETIESRENVDDEKSEVIVGNVYGTKGYSPETDEPLTKFLEKTNLDEVLNEEEGMAQPGSGIDEWAVVDTISAFPASNIRRLVSTDIPTSVLHNDDPLNRSLNNRIPDIITENLDLGSPVEPVSVEHVMKKKRSRHRRHKGGIRSPDSMSTASSGSYHSSLASTPERPCVNRQLKEVMDIHRNEVESHGMRLGQGRLDRESSPFSIISVDSAHSANPDVVDGGKGAWQDTKAPEDMSLLYALVKDGQSCDDVSSVVGSCHQQIPQNVDVVVTTTSFAESATKLKLPTPPGALSLGYPSRELLEHLGMCNQNNDLINPLSGQMNNLASMSGEEVVNFFHNSVIQIGSETEELRHLVWACVVPYTLPMQEIITCVMLSTRAVYFVSDSSVYTHRKGQSSYRTHSRNKSDSLVGQPLNVFVPNNHSSGIVNHATRSTSAVVKPYHIFQLSDLKHVNVGMFDQIFRLAGPSPENVYSCVTRNHVNTETFVKQLSRVLMLYSTTPSPDIQSSGDDFYKSFKSKRSSSTLAKSDYEHPSKVKFHYASEEMVVDLAYVIHEHLGGVKRSVEDTNILLYLLVFQMETASKSAESQAVAKPRTLVVTDNHMTLLEEDLVNYPFPDFVMAPPSIQHYRVVDARNVEYLKRVVLSDFKSHDLTLVFSDLSDEIVVDTSVEYFGQGAASGSLAVDEIHWVLAIQSLRDKDRLLKLLSRLWSDVHGDEQLSVQVSE